MPVPPELLAGVVLAVVLVAVIVLAAGRSPHVLYRPSEIEISLDDSPRIRHLHDVSRHGAGPLWGTDSAAFLRDGKLLGLGALIH